MKIPPASCQTSCCAGSPHSRAANGAVRGAHFDSLVPRVRVALLLLLLANLAYFAWSHWLAPERPALPVSPKVDAPRLQLAQRGLAGGGGNSGCVTVGPFATNELAARARQTLTDSGYPSVPREVETPVFEGYWVYLESPPTEAGERRLLDRLRKAASTKRRLWASWGARRISLGVFSEEARAVTQSEKVAGLRAAAADRGPRETRHRDLAGSHAQVRFAPSRGAEIPRRRHGARIPRPVKPRLQGLRRRGIAPRRGARLKSRPIEEFRAGLAQLVEHLICNQGVAGSIPAAGTKCTVRTSMSPARVEWAWLCQHCDE